MLKTVAGALCALLLGAAPQAWAAQAPGWIGTWGAAPVIPGADTSTRPVPRFAGQTIRQVVRISAGGIQVRVRFTNEYGTRPLHIGAARLALADTGGTIRPGSDHVLTFNGKTEVYIPEGAPMISDPIEMEVAALSSLAISLYLPDDAGPCTCHRVGSQTALISGPGDFTGATSFPIQSTTLTRPFLSGVEVRPRRAGAAIVALGDSITDGNASTADANHRWPDWLAERLYARDGARLSLGVVNQGISANRLLIDNDNQNALARFDRDVLGVAGARYLVVLLGVNDLGVNYGPPTPQRPRPPHVFTVEELIGAYKQLIERGRTHGLKVYGATITPYEGHGQWSPEGEAVRQQLNQWMRTSGAFDAVFDFDAAWRDPAGSARIRPGFGAPDNIHGVDAGYKALADAVDISLFR